LNAEPQRIGCSAAGSMLPMALLALAFLLLPRRAPVRVTRRDR
jgi:uncharacterized protein (TIGR03382 family)